ncbi:chloride channel protein [Fructobacillus ficulneus]|uniref:Chloride transporter, ClC family n=1 Tax=Fructobacillus ficulneus TaxID=157463 RepID=A0A0K8MGW7_9LACO|nr:chloride channel protein [Fructobacillus ficulneus]GAO99119.1 chloride transporter, ClC family [Fructobacillus ficulneus]
MLAANSTKTDEQPLDAESKFWSLAIATIVLAVVIGLAAILLSLFLEFIEVHFLDFHESFRHYSPNNAHPSQRFISIVIGSTIAGFVWWAIRARGSKIVGINGALKGEKMPVWKTAANVLTQMFFVGTGGSVGRELAPRQAGVMLAQTYQRKTAKIRFLWLSQEDQKLLLAAAAGAGFAGVYISPITGMLFSVELLLKKASVKTISVSLVMSTIAALMGAIVKGYNPYYALFQTTDFSRWLLVVAVILGPIAGIFGAWAKQAFGWAQNHQAKGKWLWLTMPAVGVLTGLMAWPFPQVMGNGRATAQYTFLQTDHHLLYFFIALGLAKFAMTFLSLYGGGTGGTLTPSIALGGVLGLVSSVAFHPFLPNLAPWQFALIGAVALLAASQQAPLMAMFMVFEISHLDYSALIVFALAVALSSATAKIYLDWMGTHPFQKKNLN